MLVWLGSYKELGLLMLVVIMGMLIFSGMAYIVEKDVEGNVFADSEDHSLAADIKPSDETDVTKIINEDSSVLA